MDKIKIFKDGKEVHDPCPNCLGQYSLPSDSDLHDILYDLSHNEYGDAQSKYDLSFAVDRQLIVDAIRKFLESRVK